MYSVLMLTHAVYLFVGSRLIYLFMIRAELVVNGNLASATKTGAILVGKRR